MPPVADKTYRQTEMAELVKEGGDSGFSPLYVLFPYVLQWRSRWARRAVGRAGAGAAPAATAGVRLSRRRPPAPAPPTPPSSPPPSPSPSSPPSSQLPSYDYCGGKLVQEEGVLGRGGLGLFPMCSRGIGMSRRGKTWGNANRQDWNLSEEGGLGRK